MFKLTRIRTLLLGLAVIIVTFGVFIALPALVPSLSQLNCEKVLWACSHRGPPIIYDTWFWPTDQQPEPEIRRKSRSTMIEGEGIINGLRFNGAKGTDLLKIVPDPENSSRIIVSGYLQYGFYPDDPLAAVLGVPEMVGTLSGKEIILELREYKKADSNVSSVETENLEMKTDWKGYFSFVLKPDPEADCYSITVESEYTLIVPPDIKKPLEFYLETSIEYTTCESIDAISRPISGWIWLIVAIVVISIGGLIYYFLKRRRKIVPSSETLLQPEEFVIPEKPEKEEEQRSGGDITRLRISFSEIAENLPVVWGVDEPLTVSFTLNDEEGNSVSSQNCEIDWGDNETIHLISNEDGNLSHVHVFIRKGEYVINASYEDASVKSISSWRKIRIVDYREEMVRLFNEMLEKFEMTDISIGSEMTPREIEDILKSRLEVIDELTIRRLISGFEEANYSTHPVTRDSYLNMYRSVNEVLGYGS